MRAHAVILGIDSYPKPEWCLTGAVRDAVAFARWAVTAGGVDLKDLRLLLSPLPDGPPLAELLKADQGAPDLSVQATNASWDSVAKTFQDYRTGAGRDADRLWFFYAGHGLAAPAAAPNAGPLVVPADIQDIDLYINMKPLGLEMFRGWMEDSKPNEQFFFVDACRDVLPVTGNKTLSQQLLWDVRNIEDDKLAMQNILLATTAGQRAKEIRGHGLFSRALLAALRGLGPHLSPPLAPPAPGQRAQRRLLFNEVVKFVIEAVKRALKDVPGIQPAELKGIPYARVNRLTGDIVVAEFASDSLPTAKVGAILDPDVARKVARIEFLMWNDDLGEWIVRTSNPKPMGPPVPEVAEFQLRGGAHYLRITATGFEEENRELLVYEDKRFPIELRPLPAPLPQPRSDQPGRDLPELAPPLPGGGQAGGGSFEATESSVTANTVAIVVRCQDRLARITVVDARGKQLGKGYEEVRVGGLVPGPYYVSAELTSADRVEQTIYAQAGPPVEVTLDIADPIGLALTRTLLESNILLDGNYSEPSENFGLVANARLGSILAYAAWAARWPESAGFHRLRDLGVDPLPSLQSSGSAFQVLIGDIAEKGAPFARDCRVQLELANKTPLVPDGVDVPRRDQRKAPILLSQVQGLPVAHQGSAVFAPGPIGAHVEMPGIAPTYFALSLLRGFVTVLVISREENGDIDVQQYLNPIDPMVPADPGFDPPQPDDVRVVELAWRALQGRDPLDANEYDELLHRKRSNPLLGIIAGYRMYRTEREHQFRVTPEPPINNGFAVISPLWNMVYLFPGLPDVHVLAGLYDPDRRDEHFQRAMDTGTPVLVEGFWTLVEWLTAKSMRENRPPPAMRQSVVPGMVWTSFTDSPRAEPIESLHVVTSTGRNYARDVLDDLVPEVARSVGRLAADGAPEPFVCTGFLVAPQLLLCPYFGLTSAREHEDGSWTMEKGLRVRFELGDATSERTVTRIVRTLRPPQHLVTNDDTFGAGPLDRMWPVLLQLSEPVATSPLVIAREAPEVGQRVCVIGFPYWDARIGSESFAQHFTGSAGEKHVMPGSILRASGESWTFNYDCFTAAGTAGGPVVDLETGTVVGMHVVGMPVSQSRKSGMAIAMTRFHDHPELMPWMT